MGCNLTDALVTTQYRRPITAECLIQCEAYPCGTCDGQSGIGTGLSPRVSVFSLSLKLHECSVHIHATITMKASSSTAPKIAHDWVFSPASID
jgi:hypothetical protein